MKTRKKKLKKRIGIRITGRLAFSVILLAALLPLVSASKKKPAADTYAAISGSVFDASGYALPGADATLAPDTQASKIKPLEAVSDARGEFIFRVPPGPASYVVTVSAKGRQTQRKTVNIEDQERVEVTFQLEDESK